MKKRPSSSTFGSAASNPLASSLNRPFRFGLKATNPTTASYLRRRTTKFSSASSNKVTKTYDQTQTPCDRILAFEHVSEETKLMLRARSEALDPMELSALIEAKPRLIQQIIDEIEERRAEGCDRAMAYVSARHPAAGA
jgi:hypothetical protein